MRPGRRGGRAQPGPGAHKKGGEKGAAGAASTGRSGAYLYARGRRPGDLGRERSGDGRITADGLGAGCSAARGRLDTGIGREGIVIPSPSTIVILLSDPRVGSGAWTDFNRGWPVSHFRLASREPKSADFCQDRPPPGAVPRPSDDVPRPGKSKKVDWGSSEGRAPSE